MSRLPKPQPRPLGNPDAAAKFIAGGKTTVANKPPPVSALPAPTPRARPKRVEMTLRITPEQKAKIESIAQSEDRSVQKILQRLVDTALAAYDD